MSDERYKIHNELVNKVLVYLHSNNYGRFWSNSTGAIKSISGHFQRYGLIGSSDIIGISSDGTFVGIEIKTNSGRMSKHQQNFKKMIEKHNGIYILVHDEINKEELDGRLRAKETNGRDTESVQRSSNGAEELQIEAIYEESEGRRI